MSALYTSRNLASAVALLVAGLLVSTCSPNSASSRPPDVTVPPSAQLWGDMTPIVSVKELMRDLIDPIADNIFDAVSIIVDKNGTVERSPKTEEDWERIRIGATTMAEASYLLKVRRPFTPPGEENNSVGPDAPELSAAAILAKVEKDPVEWNARIQTLRNVGLEVLEIVKRKNADELWEAAENLDVACENCHRSYWYPGENLEYYRKLDRRLADHVATSTRTSAPAAPRK